MALIAVAIAIVVTALLTVDHVETASASTGHSSFVTVEAAPDASTGCVGDDLVLSTCSAATPLTPVVPVTKARPLALVPELSGSHWPYSELTERTAWICADEPDRLALGVHRT